MAVTLNASTSTGYIQTADTSGDLALQSNGTTQFTVASTGAYGQVKSGTAVASTSGTSIDFTSLPSWVKRITVMFSAVSTSGTSNIQIQLGDSGGVETTGYNGIMMNSGGGSTIDTQISTGFGIRANNAGYVLDGLISICKVNNNTYVASGTLSGTGAGTGTFITSGRKDISDTLDRVRITTVNGTDTFDAGTINILYEG